VTLPAPGKVVLINFFATWCGPCQLELPHIEKIWSDLKHEDGFQLVVIGREETPEAVRAFRQERGFSFPMAADPDRAIYSLFAKELIPRTLVISPKGQVVYSTAGFLETDLEELNAMLKEQLSQGAVTETN
jgi:thiol-disulfide isomerase/thioredoxin